VVRDWNTLVERIPSLWIAAAAGYGERPYFQLDEAERAAPRVTFGAEETPGAGTVAGASPTGTSQPR
jgi:LemA protein